MQGERRLANLKRDLQAVTPDLVRVKARDVTVDFEDYTIRLLLNKDDKRYPYRATYQAGGANFDIPTGNNSGYRYGRHRDSSSDYAISEKALDHVAEYVHTVIRQTRQAYTRVLSTMAPEWGLRVLDGEKPEETLVQYARTLLPALAAQLPKLHPSVDTFEMSCLDGSVSAQWHRTQWLVQCLALRPDSDGRGHPLEVVIPRHVESAVTIIRNLELILAWHLKVQATARAIRRAQS